MVVRIFFLIYLAQPHHIQLFTAKLQPSDVDLASSFKKKAHTLAKLEGKRKLEIRRSFSRKWSTCGKKKDEIHTSTSDNVFSFPLPSCTTKKKEEKNPHSFPVSLSLLTKKLENNLCKKV